MSHKYKSSNAQEYQYKIIEGNNGKQFISRPDKNGIFRWVRFSQGNTPEEYFLQFPNVGYKQYLFPTILLDKLKRELLEKNILFFKIGWKNVWNYTDYAWEDAIARTEKSPVVKKLRIINKHDSVMKLISFVFYTDNRRYFSEINGTLDLQHNILKKDTKTIKEVFAEYFGKRFVWNGTKNKTISLKLQKK